MVQHGESKAGQDRYDQSRESRRRYGIPEDVRVLVNVVQISTGMVTLRECGGLLREKNALGSGKHIKSIVRRKGMEGQNKRPNAKGDISNRKKEEKSQS